MFSCCFGYIVDKPKLDEIKAGLYKNIYWKCVYHTCKARAISNGVNPPVQITNNHDHLPDTSKLLELKQKDQVRILAGTTNDAPITIIMKT